MAGKIEQPEVTIENSPPPKAGNRDPASNEATKNDSPSDEAVVDFKSIMDILVPQDTVEVVDLFGNNHMVRSSIPARAQIKILRELDSIKTSALAEQIQGIGDGGMGNIVGALASLADDPKVLTALAKCFQYAHPQVVQSVGEEATEKGIEWEDAADLFGIEEVIAGIIPLFIRLMKRAAQAAGSMESVTVA